MSTQSELVLEKNLVKQLSENGYGLVNIKDEPDLIRNLQLQLEKFNQAKYSKAEFKMILSHLTKPLNPFDKAKILRDKFTFKNEQNETVYVSFLNMEQWCQNEYQVTKQISIDGKYKNRYDVTILINGLPLVQIELKKRGLELKEAFNQIERYKKHTYASGMGMFQYIQIYVISNGVNTKYYTYLREPDFKFTFNWTDNHNKRVSDLENFAAQFLDKCHVSKMITRYIVLHEGNKEMMILRPYQYYAVEHIIERVKTSPKNGYIWHTTGSGKTLTSFKASQILARLPKVDKVVFCVDRCDLDYQTSKEFNEFSPGSVDSTENTKTLVKQFADPNVKLIVTTIQKLNTAISKEHHKKVMDELADRKVVFIFDECHRSQFGDTHKRIVQYFKNHQLFGFTGTPIFKENALSKNGVKRLTTSLFGDRLHEYVITDAISDGNVLPFSIEYTGRYRYKSDSNNLLDIEVEAIDTRELLESDDRIGKISEYVIANHKRKSKSKGFTGMFCISNTKTLIKYYDLFRKLKSEGKHDFSIATIFSYTANEDPNNEVVDDIPEDDLDFSNSKIDQHTRDVLDKYIAEYNQQFGSNYSTKDSKAYNDYYKNVAKRVRNREIDILFVVNMFLTGFDSPTLNTLYVDKNLRYHGLIQAYSRTNRLKGDKKSHGQVVVFRNLKKQTDDAIALFSDPKAKEVIIVPPLEDFIQRFNEAASKLLAFTPTVGSVDDLYSEDEKLDFVKAFRELIRIKNTMDTYSDFSFNDLDIDEQIFADFTSKYKDLHCEVKNRVSKEKESVLDDVDFQMELLHRDEINVNYILRLLADVKSRNKNERAKREKEIIDMVASDPILSSKRDLIEKFILENLPHVDEDRVEDEFEVFVNHEKEQAIKEYAIEENMNLSLLQEVIAHYEFSGRKPTRTELIDTLNDMPSFRVRSEIGDRLFTRFNAFVSKFIE